MSYFILPYILLKLFYVFSKILSKILSFLRVTFHITCENVEKDRNNETRIFCFHSQMSLFVQLFRTVIEELSLYL